MPDTTTTTPPAHGDAATQRLVDAGARLVAMPTRTPWDSRNARLRDPDGVQLTLFTELAPIDEEVRP